MMLRAKIFTAVGAMCCQENRAAKVDGISVLWHLALSLSLQQSSPWAALNLPGHLQAQL